jgi:uncharacterized protein
MMIRMPKRGETLVIIFVRGEEMIMEQNATTENIIEQLMKQIAKEMALPITKVRATVELLDGGNTIPFIARYRKEMTGELDENELRGIEERLQYLRGLEERKGEVLRLIEEQGKLTDELAAAIKQAVKLQEVEDLYRPYRQKRKTRASVAKERGLEPLAVWIMAQPKTGSLEQEAAKYVDGDNGVDRTDKSVGSVDGTDKKVGSIDGMDKSVASIDGTDKKVGSIEEAIQGAMDIIAEIIADDAKVRAWVRKFTFDQGTILTDAKDKKLESVYEMYYEYKEPVRRLPPHRTLAINRGEREDVLKVGIDVPTERVHEYIGRQYIRGESVTKAVLIAVVEDAYKRLLSPSIEREVRGELSEKAEEHAIQIFAENLRNLLLQAPVKGRVVLGVDPAFRTGCKLAVVDDTGKLLEVAVTYPTAPHHRTAEAEAVFKRLITQYQIDLLVIGNGTASRETEQFVVEVIKQLPERELKYIIVSEAGASVYSASKLAQEEFPDLDVAERSAASIARRLQDPLAELVKIEPKAIGVGQYQHDVAAKKLEESLKFVVESAVNHVGVDLNTASWSLLSYVSGINATTAKNIVKYREEAGRFVKRDQLKKVPRLGAKTYEQSVGFLRISDGDYPLDNTPIHPESYDVVKQLFKELRLELSLLGSQELKDQLKQMEPEQLATQLGVGVPTLRDILDSLQRPGRDPREELPLPIFHTDILKLEDLSAGMELTGTVRNVIDFGAFVDIGIKNDGLVHISQMSDKFIKHPMDVVSIGDIVKVWVLSVDANKGRVSLTMRQPS